MEQKVLVVDDEPAIHEVLVPFLEAHGYRAASADGWQKASKQLAQFQPDLVVLDFKLPEVDGEVICEAFKDIDRRVPIIIYSALDDRRTRESAASRGADAYVCKKEGQDRLLAEIRRLLPPG